jgi:transposase
MRGVYHPEGHIFSYLSPEEQFAKIHPLRKIKQNADAVLEELPPVFNAVYSDTGRRRFHWNGLLKSLPPSVLHSVRSDRLFCEMLDYNILCRCFPRVNLEDGSFDAPRFSKNREWLLAHAASQKAPE